MNGAPLLDSILFVDDDPITNFYHLNLANKMQVAREIVVKTHGEDAIHFINERYWSRQSLPSIILLDLNMPLVNGMEFISALRSSELLGVKNIPVAIITCSTAPHDLACLCEQGYCYVYKPLTEEKFYEIIHNTLSLSSSL